MTANARITEAAYEAARQALKDQWDLEATLIYCLLVAGKSAGFAKQKTNALLAEVGRPMLPLEYAEAQILMDRSGGRLDTWLRTARTGSYARLAQAFRELTDADLDLRKCSIEDLENIHGIGPKTARLFVMWTRPETRAHHAILDVHVLRWLREIGHTGAPRSTPTGTLYRFWERIFLDEAARRGKSAWDLDRDVWLNGSGWQE